ncbi:MAG TPA: hypothetical protein V6C99_08350 [Oculatellaceae cyanobacterium]
MSASSIYLKHEITIKDLGDSPKASLTNKWLFVGIDMAPIDTLETGIAVLDRKKHILRMDKLDEDDALLKFLDNLGPASNIVVALDIPKSLNIPSKWRQQQIKMHPLRLLEKSPHIPEPVPTDRYAQRAKDFYDEVQKRGILIFSFFAPHAKLRYQLNTPFRSRSPHGCRALQALLKQKLALKDIPTNLAPSSVLDAMIGAYSAWLLCHGKENEHFKLYQDDEKRLYMDPLKRPVAKTPLRRANFQSLS